MEIYINLITGQSIIHTQYVKYIIIIVSALLSNAVFKEGYSMLKVIQSDLIFKKVHFGTISNLAKIVWQNPYDPNFGLVRITLGWSSIH